jgi:hypothetical protein
VRGVVSGKCCRSLDDSAGLMAMAVVQSELRVAGQFDYGNLTGLIRPAVGS